MNIIEILLNTFKQNFIFFVFLLLCVFISFVIKTRSFKGFLGEFFVKKVLTSRLKNTEHVLLNDILLETNDGTTQIDHILIMKSGVYVIETKNIKGWIYGSMKSKMWTQKLFKQSFKFQNPFHQNYKHIKTLSDKLNINEKDIKTIIIFTNGEFKSKYIKGLYFSVSSFLRDLKNEKDIEINIYEIAENINNMKKENTYKNKKNHIKHINEIKQKKID